MCTTLSSLSFTGLMQVLLLESHRGQATQAHWTVAWKVGRVCHDGWAWTEGVHGQER